MPDKLLTAWSDDGVECPFCGHLRTDDLYDYDEGRTYNTECGQCERKFVLTLHKTISYRTDAR